LPSFLVRVAISTKQKQQLQQDAPVNYLFCFMKAIK
jgi:hypothetical protein